jgi:glycosyltransferase involved in cell wall biosynthesis
MRTRNPSDRPTMSTQRRAVFTERSASRGAGASPPRRRWPLRRFEAIRRWVAAADYTVLHILHNAPTTSGKTPSGGTEYHVADLTGHLPAAAHWSLFAHGESWWLTAHCGRRERAFRLCPARADLAGLIDRDLFDVVHLHQPRGLPRESLAEALARHGRYAVSLHDYELCCPRTHLVTPAGRVCNGHECAARCGQVQAEIDRLRSVGAAILGSAAAVVHFSRSTREKTAGAFRREFAWRLIEHGLGAAFARNGASRPAAPPAPGPRDALRVAFLGGFSAVKGAELVCRLSRRGALPDGTPVEWHLLGTIHGALGAAAVRHGRYVRDALPGLLRAIDPHLVVIPSVAPETYCLTLDEAWSCGIPVLVTPEGAPAERVAREGGGWILPALDDRCVLEQLGRIAGDWPDYLRARRRAAAAPLRGTAEIARQYDELYREIAGEPQTAERRQEALDGFLRYVSRRRITLRQRAASRGLKFGLRLLGGLNLRRWATALVRRSLPADAYRELKKLVET